MTHTLSEAAKLALDALNAGNLTEDQIVGGTATHIVLRMPIAAISQMARAKDALREALAAPQAEPVAYALQSTHDASIMFDKIAACGWHNFDKKLDELKADAWVSKGRANIVPLYATPPAPQASPVPDGMVMVPRDILARLVEEARVFEPSVLDPDALAHARRILAAAPAPVVPNLAHKPTVQHLMDLARKFRSAPGDLYDGPYKALQDACYAALSAAPVVREPLTVNSPEVLAAAKKLAEVMDYPWEHMPEQGRATMKANALQVLQAASGGGGK